MYLVMKVIKMHYPQCLGTQNNNKNCQKQQITMFDDIKQLQHVSKCDSICQILILTMVIKVQLL